MKRKYDLKLGNQGDEIVNLYVLFSMFMYESKKMNILQRIKLQSTRGKLIINYYGVTTSFIYINLRKFVLFYINCECR